MATRPPILATVLRRPSPDAVCTCSHWVDCDCRCHDRHCDPSQSLCHLDFLPDEGGLAWWGCADCTPGQGAPHILGCELIGWSVPVPPGRLRAGGGSGGPVAIA